MALFALQLLLIRQSVAFFFPTGGGGSGCQCAACPQPIACPPAPTCAIPLPCPAATNYAPSTASAESYYQGSYQQVQPIAQPLPSPIGISAPQQVQSPFQTPTYQSLAPTYQTVDHVYQTAVPAYTAPEHQFTNAVQPIQPVQTVASIHESESEAEQYSTLVQTPAPSLTDPYDIQDHASIVTFNNAAPAIPPPVPSTYVYKTTTDEVSDVTIHDNEAQLVPTATSVAPPLYYSRENLEDQLSAYEKSLHAGSTNEPWIEVPFHRRISTEVVLLSNKFLIPGYSPMEKYQKRYMVLKRMRNARQLAGTVPRTNTTCNSRKLANVMVRVMVADVSVSKRAVLRATELAFDGDKYDVFCATGEFSYSIHSRKYCEVTKDDITCFAFR